MNHKLTLNTKNIEMVVKKDLCTGCGTCAGICPKNAIEMIIDHHKGIYLPQIVQEECSNCGICYSICPGHEVNFKLLNNEFFGQEPEDPLLGNYINCYTGYATDYEIRYNSASGGLITALLIFAIEEGIIDGALVTKMRDDRPLEPQPFIARTREEIISASCSKYCPVPANIALKEILKNDGRYAVVGLPCHLHGIRKAEMIMPRLKEKIILHLGIFCGKNISFLGTKYYTQKLKIKESKIKKIKYRGKGWPGSTIIELKNAQNKIIEISPYFYDTRFTPFRCTLCNDGLAELADISFGDAWLPEIKAHDKIGTSIIVARTLQANKILQIMEIKGSIKLKRTTPNHVKRSQCSNLNSKKLRIKSFFQLSTIFCKKTPNFHQSLPNPPKKAYLSTVILYSQMFLASRRSLWWLFDIYCNLLSFAGKIKAKLTR